MSTNTPTLSSQSPVPVQPRQPKRPPEWLAAKFWDDETGEVRLEALARSYNELERRLGDPEDAARRAGPTSNVPADASSYQLDVDDLLDIDDDVNKRLFEAGFSNEQAQLVYDLARERLVPLIEQMGEQADDNRQMEQLSEHFGGPDAFVQIRDQLRSWGKANLSNSVFETLAGSVEGVIAMHTMMQSGEPGLGGNVPAMGGAGEQDLKRMMADPRYWRDRDPSYVAQVREGFKRLYPDR